jgi:hypothetical protein
MLVRSGILFVFAVANELTKRERGVISLRPRVEFFYSSL